jgi:hypothetical protein
VCEDDNSPIVIDAFGEGFHLTNVPGGVKFRELPADALSQMSWTDQRFRNGWLALDRNGNGQIDSAAAAERRSERVHRARRFRRSRQWRKRERLHRSR